MTREGDAATMRGDVPGEHTVGGQADTTWTAHATTATTQTAATGAVAAPTRIRWLPLTIFGGVVLALVAIVVTAFVIVPALARQLSDAEIAALEEYTGLVAEGRFDEAGRIVAVPDDAMTAVFAADAAVTGRTSAPSDFTFAIVDADEARTVGPVGDGQRVVRVGYRVDGFAQASDLRIETVEGRLQIVDPLVVAVGIVPAVHAPLVVGDVRLEVPSESGMQDLGWGTTVRPVHASFYPGVYTIDADYFGYYEGEPQAIHAFVANSTMPFSTVPAPYVGAPGNLPLVPFTANAIALPVEMRAEPTAQLRDEAAHLVDTALATCFPAVTDSVYSSFSNDTVCGRVAIVTVFAPETLYANLGWTVTAPTIEITGWYLEADGGTAVLTGAPKFAGVTPLAYRTDIAFTAQLDIADGSLSLGIEGRF